MKTKAVSAGVEVLDGGVAPVARKYKFTVTRLLGTDGDGFRVEARGPRGGVETSVLGPVTAETVVGAIFWRS